MSTGQTWRIDSTSLEATLATASAVGAKLCGGETIELISDLGGGKTSFVRGLAKGAGYTGVVRSPSFTLNNEYAAPSLTIFHFDFYRLSQPGIMRDELAELLNDPRAVVIIEWADIVADVLPPERLTIQITATSEEARRFDFSAPQQLAYLRAEA